MVKSLRAASTRDSPDFDEEVSGEKFASIWSSWSCGNMKSINRAWGEASALLASNPYVIS